jgi:hypothetical protein
MAIHITIDELVLHGVDRRDRDAITDAIREAIAEHVRGSDIAPAVPAAERVSRTFVAGELPARAVGAGAGREIAAVINGARR